MKKGFLRFSEDCCVVDIALGKIIFVAVFLD